MSCVPWIRLVFFLIIYDSIAATDIPNDNSTNVESQTAQSSVYSGHETRDDRKITAKEKRAAVAGIKQHIRGLVTTREKVPPYWIDEQGEAKVNVSAFVSVLAVFYVDDVQQTMTSGIYTVFRWWDESLAWNAAEHHNVTYVTLPADEVWTPDVFVANSANKNDLITEYAQEVKVYHSGKVTVYLRMYVNSICSLNLEHFPYDEQMCPILILTMADHLVWRVYNTQSVGQQLADALRIESEWEIRDISVGVMHLANDEDETIQIMITLRRKRTFYTVCLVLPMALTSYMNTLVFLLPLQAGEKVSFLVSIYVSTSVYISFFTTVMPRGLDSVPSTMKLLIGVTVESLLVLLATIVVLRRYHQQQQQDGIQPPESSKRSSPSGRIRLSFRDSSVPAADHVAGSSEMAAVRNEKEKKSKQMRAEKLDQIFFAVFFFGNTVFLAFLLFIP